MTVAGDRQRVAGVPWSRPVRHREEVSVRSHKYHGLADLAFRLLVTD